MTKLKQSFPRHLKQDVQSSEFLLRLRECLYTDINFREEVRELLLQTSEELQLAWQSMDTLSYEKREQLTQIATSIATYQTQLRAADQAHEQLHF